MGALKAVDGCWDEVPPGHTKAPVGFGAARRGVSTGMRETRAGTGSGRTTTDPFQAKFAGPVQRTAEVTLLT